jgi:hypothetical protein
MVKQKIDPIEYLNFLLSYSYHARPIIDSIICLLEMDRNNGEVEFLDWAKVMKNASDFERDMKSAAQVLEVARGYLISMAEDIEDQEGEEQ